GAGGCSYAVLPCRPAEWEPTLSSAALGALLHGVLDRALPQLPPPQRRALEVAVLLADPVGSQPEQRAVCVAFLAVIRQLSAAGPVVLAIDDLQWLDIPSAAVVEFALRRLSREGAGLLASVRDRGDGRSAVAAGTGLAGDRLTRLRIGPLTLGAFQSAVRAMTGAGLSRLTIRRPVRPSGGDPFYGLGLARAP